jgi:hypothetical protein
MRLSNDAIPPRAKASWLPCYGSVRGAIRLRKELSELEKENTHSGS